MTILNYVFASIGMVISIMWLFDSNFEYEPALVVIGNIGAIAANIANRNTNSSSLTNGLRYNRRLVSFFILAAAIVLFMLSIAKFPGTTIIGIKGDHNQNNTIDIK